MPLRDIFFRIWLYGFCSLSFLFNGYLKAQQVLYKEEEVSVMKNYADTSSSTEVLIVFEIDFDDSTEIYFNEQRVFEGVLKTDKRLQAVPNFIQLTSRIQRDKNNYISIYLKQKKILANVPYLEGHRYIFVTRWKNRWYVEYTNHMKDLR